MTVTCADEFELQGTNNRYKHDAFFDTYCDDDSAFKIWMYTIKDEYFKVYMGYLFTKYQCEYIIPRIISRNKEVHICKLHNEIELKHEEFTCEL